MEHQIQPGEIFVFGSNLAGRHGRGAANTAYRYYGAIYNVGEGRMGQSYAIPTKRADLSVLSLTEIMLYTQRFIDHAKANPNERFFVTAIGTGLAGYRHEQIAPFFSDAPDNCRLPPEWVKLLNRA